MTDSAAPPPRAVVLVPVKSFSDAKVRLAGVLDERSRAELARSMATRVLHAAAPLPVAVVCDDDDVAKWAIDNGASAIHTDRVGLNPAVAFGVSFLAADDVERVIVAHADLPFATGLAALGDAAVDEVVLVPDRRGDGTNVASIPTGATPDTYVTLPTPVVGGTILVWFTPLPATNIMKVGEISLIGPGT